MPMHAEISILVAIHKVCGFAWEFSLVSHFVPFHIKQQLMWNTQYTDDDDDRAKKVENVIKKCMKLFSNRATARMYVFG